MKLSILRINGRAGTVQAGSQSGIPPLIRRNTVYIALVQALQGSGGQLAITLGALMVVRLHGSASLAGIGGSILGAGRFAAAYPTGKFTDAYGRRPGMVISLLVSLVGGILLGASIALSSFLVFLVGMAILGLGVGAGRQLRVAAVDMYPPARRAEGLGYVLTGSIVGALVAPMVVGGGELLARLTGADAIGMSWYLLQVVLAPAMIFALLVRPDPKSIAANLKHYWPSYQLSAKTGDATSAAGLSTFLRHRPKQVAFVCYATAQGTMSLMMVMTPLVMSESGHSVPSISLTVAFHVLGMFGFSIPLGRLVDRVGRKPLLGVGLAVEAAGAILVPTTASYLVITLGLFLVGIGWSAVNVSSTVLLADTTSPEERGRAIGASDTFAGVFSIVMPLMGGFVVDMSGLMAIGILGGALALAPFPALVRLQERSPGQYGETDSSAG
ncbi:MAG: MFS transporter [Chloroflexi bacterium]|nr:MFS transporter [Chloroflexota bacterium]